MMDYGLSYGAFHILSSHVDTRVLENGSRMYHHGFLPQNARHASFSRVCKHHLA